MIELEFLKGIFKFQVSIVYASFFNEVPQHSDLKCHVIKIVQSMQHCNRYDFALFRKKSKLIKWKTMCSSGVLKPTC